MLNIGILMGGKSTEHEVSLASGNEVYKNINRNIYKPYKLLINKDGSFNFSLNKLSRMDVVFIALHGKGGEDGTIQGFLETLGVKYTGPKILASTICIDKALTKDILRQNRIPIIPYRVINVLDDIRKVDIPCIIKPNDQGSSVGVTILKKMGNARRAFETAKKYSSKILLAPYVTGIEITVGIVGNKNPTALPIIEIIPKNEFFDYEAKYTSGMSTEIVPARISKELTKKAQKIALRTYEAIGCVGFSRIDLFITRENEILVMEVNTIPGLTSNSLLPKAAKAAGIEFKDLISKIIEYALEG